MSGAYGLAIITITLLSLSWKVLWKTDFPELFTQMVRKVDLTYRAWFQFLCLSTVAKPCPPPPRVPRLSRTGCSYFGASSNHTSPGRVVGTPPQTTENPKPVSLACSLKPLPPRLGASGSLPRKPDCVHKFSLPSQWCAASEPSSGWVCPPSAARFSRGRGTNPNTKLSI